MKTLEDLNKIMEQVNGHYQTLLSIYHDEMKEGYVHDNTVIRFNALMLSMDKAYKALDKGLEGEF